MIQSGQGQGSWLVPLADLSLILFILTGSAISATPGDARVAAADPEPARVPGEANASAIHFDGEGAPPLAAMLDAHVPAAGEQLTIAAYYAPGDRLLAARRAEALAGQAQASGVEPRVVLQPAPATQVLAFFAFDREAQLAHNLRE